MRRIVIMAAILLAGILLSGCDGYELSRVREVPSSFDSGQLPGDLRATIASDFPAYEVVLGDVGDGEAAFILRSNSTTFAADVSYKKQSDGPAVQWVMFDDLGGLDLRDSGDPRVASLIGFFADRFPEGDAVFQGTTPQGEGRVGDRYRFDVYRMRAQNSSAPYPRDLKSPQAWDYDTATDTWSAR